MKTYLFQGDSITDAFRPQSADLKYLGQGYATMTAGLLHQKFPGRFEFLNRGVSGNRIVDLYARIKQDVINLKPDYMSVLIGVNDVGHEFTHQNGVDPEKYEKIYTMFIEEVKAALPDIKIVILEPFIADGEWTREQGSEIRGVVEQTAAKAQKIAEKFDLPFVPLQAKINELVEKFGESYVTHEGVHPTPVGHGVIAASLVEVLEKEVL